LSLLYFCCRYAITTPEKERLRFALSLFFFLVNTGGRCFSLFCLITSYTSFTDTKHLQRPDSVFPKTPTQDHSTSTRRCKPHPGSKNAAPHFKKISLCDFKSVRKQLTLFDIMFENLHSELYCKGSRICQRKSLISVIILLASFVAILLTVNSLLQKNKLKSYCLFRRVQDLK